MINTFIAYDDNDGELGDYFQDSHDDIRAAIILDPNVANISIPGLNCTDIFITQSVLALAGSRFIFIAVSHGTEEELVSHVVYVSITNAQTFSNSLFYSCACSTGIILGDHLIDAGCMTFIGYVNTVIINVDYYSTFYSCQNYGIKSFLNNDETIETSFDKMLTNYNEEIERLILGTTDDVIAASSLIGNRDCLVILGSLTITRADFNT